MPDDEVPTTNAAVLTAEDAPARDKTASEVAAERQAAEETASSQGSIQDNIAASLEQERLVRTGALDPVKLHDHKSLTDPVTIGMRESIENSKALQGAPTPQRTPGAYAPPAARDETLVSAVLEIDERLSVVEAKLASHDIPPAAIGE